MNRNSDWDHHDRHDGNSDVEDFLLLRVSVPPKGENLVEAVEPFSIGESIPQNRDVWNQWDVEKDTTRREIGGNTHGIPEERRLISTIKKGHVNLVGATEVKKDICGTNEKDSDRDHLGHSSDGSSPFGLSHAQNG